MSRARDIANYGDGIDTSSITSGTFADGRIAQSNVTQHESAIDALASNPTVTLGSNATFPTGHIIQSVFSPSISANTTGHTSEAVAASVTNQISITSGNGVLIYVQAGDVYLDRDTGDMGYYARIRKGTSTSGSQLSILAERHTAHPSNWATHFSLIAFDASPDTSPDYCLTLALLSSGAHYVRLNDISNDYLKIYMFEVKQ